MGPCRLFPRRCGWRSLTRDAVGQHVDELGQTGQGSNASEEKRSGAVEQHSAQSIARLSKLGPLKAGFGNSNEMRAFVFNLSEACASRHEL